MSDIDARVFAAFQVEYPEHLEHLRSLLGVLETGESAPDFQKALRHAHNLKGAARAVDLYGVEKLAHRLETVFARAGRGELTLGAGPCALIHAALDSMDDQIKEVVAGRSPPEPSEVLHRLDRLLAGEESAAPAPARTESRPGPADETMRVAVTRMEHLLGSASLVVQESLRQDELLREVASLRASVDHLARTWERTSRGARSPHRMTEALEPLVRDVARQARRVQRLQHEGTWALKRCGRRLQEDVQQVMMVPARTVFEGFPKMMRDLARDLGKTFEFTMHGLDVQADRRVLQILKDPLLHLLRNAAHHGIEPPADRRGQGKSPNGKVALRLQQRGTRLHIRVEDDGRGVDLDRVKQVAARRGVLPEGELTHAEASSLLFLPGFSTSQVITEVAGRGVGLSVVQDAMTQLRGDVRVEAGSEGGTAFVLTVPVSLALQTLFLVAAQEQTYALPTSGIDRLYRIPIDQIGVLEGRPTVPTRTGPMPLWSLSHLLFRDGSPPSQANNRVHVAVLKAGHARVAVAVDAFLGKTEGVLKGLGPVVPAGLQTAAGLVLGDGSICLALSPSDLLDAARGATQTPLPSVAADSPQTAAERPRVLVVDDSFTTRTLEKGILESNGYQVYVAVDGVEALQILRAETIDLVIADVQMPRMDGFGLLEALKSDPRTAALPVILVTSLESRQDQERGLQLGASAYIVKRKFEQRALLETVRQLL